MRIKFLPLLAALAMQCHAAAPEVSYLKCEYKNSPLGIDERAPRLSWRLESAERGQRQTAYRVLIASSAQHLEKGEGDCWDSGRVGAEQSQHVRYAGKPLAARQTVFWKVKIWDKDGAESAWSSVATWEMGLPESADWAGASWIRLEKDTRNSPLSKRAFQTRAMTEPKVVQAKPSPLLRREFEVKPGVKRARAYVCGLGYHEVFLNGQRCGDAVLEPGQTSYDVHAYYVTHDVTRLLRSGRNAIGVMLGNGFYGQSLAFASSLRYGAPGLLAKVVIDYEDGGQETLVTDAAWRATTGPIVFDNVYAGETYDARLELKGWDLPGFDDSGWQAAQVQTLPLSPVLKAQMIPPIRQNDTLQAKTFWTDTGGKVVFDLGLNIAGWARLRVNEPAGTVITLRFAEVLMPNGKDIDTASTGPFATGFEQIETYVCCGAGNEEWQPRFTYHGFRYIEVSGLSQPRRESLLGVRVYSDVARAATFACSDELLNQIYATSLRTIEGNLHSVPEDCPHREKCAWLGDAHAAGEAMILNYDMAQFFTKFMADVETVCGRGGVTYQGVSATPGIPCNIAVGKRLCQEARPDWGDAVILVPWYMYVYYGDTQVMEAHFPLMKRWLAYVSGMAKEHIVYQGYGDWCPPSGRDPKSTPVELTSTAFHYGSLRRAAEMARVLGKVDEAKAWDAEADLVRVAFNRAFLDPQLKSYGTQTANAVALRFELPEEADVAHVAARLVERIQAIDGGHNATGIHGARPFFTVLDDFGHGDVAMDVMTAKGFPGFRYLLDAGMTTWPERFIEFIPGERMPDRSYNHPMQAGFTAWLHECVAGIRPVATAPGFRHIEMKPQQVRRLEWVKASHEAPTGMIRSEWSSKGGVFRWKVVVPPNSTATVHVPAASADSVKESGRAAASAPGVKFVRHETGRAVYEIASGAYEFVSAL